MKSFVVAICIACLVIAFGEKIRYDNYRIYSLNVSNEEQLKALNELEADPDGTMFIEPPTGAGQIAELLVPPHKFAYIAELFETHNIKNHIKISNVQKLIDAEQQPSFKSFDDGFGWNKYQQLHVIYKWLDDLLKKYPNILTNYVYGKSYEGRPLRAIKVSHKKGNPTIFLESTIHAREWISTATATYFLNELLTSNKPEIRNLANNYDWVIVPVANVDGYVYSHNGERFWRKTRKPTPNKRCIGADMNRNFDSHFAKVGASIVHCSETYPGTHPFSEPETLALAQFIEKFDIKLYLAFHSFNQLVMFPYGHTKSRVRNFNDLYRIGVKAKEAISKRYGTQYRVGSPAEIFYPASGSSMDWVYDNRNVSLSYTFELRDTGDYGFVLPTSQIIPNSLEIIDGLVAMFKEAKQLNYL